MKKNIYVWFGGSFSPPTYAHIDTILETVRKLHGTYPTTKIVGVFVPVNKYYNKESVSEACISEENRLAMLQLLVDQLNSHNLDFAEFKVGDYEIRRGKKTRRSVPLFASLKLLEKANKSDPHLMYVIMRQHTFESILRNKLPFSEKLLEGYNFVILPTDEGIMYDLQLETRLLDSLDAMAKEMHGRNIKLRNRIMFASPRQQVSSLSAIARRSARNGESLASLTLAPISDLIREKGLYKSAACFSDKTRRRRTLKVNRKYK
jgi:nicotinic acid mononucleotide adenylyltransferase